MKTSIAALAMCLTHMLFISQTGMAQQSFRTERDLLGAVSYTHLTLPTNREV